MNESIAVVGVGAIGGVCAAELAAAGRDVTCCVRTGFDALVLEAPTGVVRATPRVALDPAAVGPVDWVLLATKAHQTDGAAAWLGALLGAGARVAVLQNGVEQVARLARLVDPARIVPVVIACPSTAIAPGHVVQRAPARLTVPDDDGGAGFAALFDGTGVAVDLTEQVEEQRDVGELVPRVAFVDGAVVLQHGEVVEERGPVVTDGAAELPVDQQQIRCSWSQPCPPWASPCAWLGAPPPIGPNGPR